LGGRRAGILRAVRDAPLPPAAAACLVFVASGAVLVLEILGIRLLAPYVGLTLETTTTIIGTVLAGIAAGAALGGRAADRMDARRLLPELLIGGALLAIGIVPLVRTLGAGVQGGGDGAALTVTLVALFPSAAVLSAVTPTVAKLQLRDLDATGSVVGRLSAWATAGGLVGTFATGFVVVPLLPTDVAVFAVGGALLVLGIGLALHDGARSRRAAAGLAAGAMVVGAATLAAGSPCDAETAYHCARVERDGASGRILVLDDLQHSYVDLRDPRRLEFDYTRWIGDAIDGVAAPGARLDAVFLGGGGFTLPRYLAATRPGSRSRVLEVDGPLVDLARERLALRTSRALRVRVGDARVTLRDEPDASADVVVGDAFGGRAVPWHLATVEFARAVRRVLRPGGVYAVNVIDAGPLDLARAVGATLLQVFGDVVLVAHRDGAGGPDGGNLVFVASPTRVPPAARVGSRAALVLGRAAVARVAAGADPLRDDDAPADQLLTPV
jgi:SAM-dependent methyltransferase